MTFQEAEKTYKDLRLQHSAGKVTDPDFEAQVNQLKVQDANGRWWQLGVRTGEWYYNDGQKWVKGKPPIAPAQPAAPAEEKAAPSTNAMSAPPPAPPAEPAPKEEKTVRPSVMPRGLFAAKPEGSSGGGLSRPVLIGIIAVVAVVVIALLVGGFLFAQSFLGGSARATTTPTQVAILVPTSALIVVATATPAATSTPAVTATLVITAANTVEPAARNTATRGAVVARTVTPTKAAAASATPAPPPGLYVTKIAIDRSIEANQKFGFRVTFFNNSGGPAHKDKWLVLIFRKKDLVEGVQEKPFGQSQIKTLDVPAGTAEVSLSEAYQLGPSGQPDCNYVAEANYIGDNNNPVPFPGTGTKSPRFEFSFCQ